MTRRLVVFSLAWVALLAHGLSGQQGQPSQPPVFRADVDAVELDVFVTDSQRNPVTSLTRDDFLVEEDGVRQDIMSFSLVDIPMKTAASAGRPLAEPDVRGNTQPLGRIYVFAIDSLAGEYALRSRRFLRRFIEDHFTANDVAALVYVTRGQARNTQDFTSSPRRLLDAIDNIMGTGSADILGSGTGALAAGRLNYLNGPRERTESLQALTESLAQIRGRRKVMLYFTSGLGMDIFDTLDHSGGTKSIAFDHMHAALAAATRGGVAIYPIDPSGLTLQGSLSEAVDLRALADATGAEAVVNTNGISDGLERIVRENSTYYVLGYASTNDRREGRFRNVSVRSTRPGLSVRTRRGYLEPRRNAPKLDTSTTSPLPSTLAKAIGQPLSDPSVPMHVFATPYRTGVRQAAVLIAQEMDATALGLAETNGAKTTDVAGTAVAVRFDGKIYGGRYNWRPVSVSQRGDTVRLVSEIQVPSGRYQLRVAGGTKERAGSVTYDLEVPDYSKTPLAMSGVALLSETPANTTTIDLSTRARDLPGAVTTRRDFDAGETVTLYAEVYERERKAGSHAIDVSVELRAADGRVVRTVSQQRSSADVGAGMNGFTVSLPLDGSAPGEHVIHVQVRANTDDSLVVSRDVPVRIR